MKIIVYCLLGLLLYNKSFSQNFEKDTIKLDSVVIDKSKPKLKTVKLDGEQRANNAFYFSNPQALYLIEDIPYGELKELTLYFGSGNMMPEGYSKRLETVYTVDFYELNDANMPGRKVNAEPYTIAFDESRKPHVKKTLDVSPLKFKTNRFFIRLDLVSSLPSDSNGIYIPSIYQSDNKLYFMGDVEHVKVHEGLQEKDASTTHFALRMQLKTLTREY